MLILSAHKGNDTGGQGWRLSQAFRDEPDWEFRSSCNGSAVLPYLAFPEDIPWGDWQLLRALYLDADLFHARNDWRTYEQLGGNKPAVIHYHGTNFRHLWAQRLRQQRERIGLVSTLDLWLIAPDRLEWLPSPYDLEWLHAVSLRSA